MTRKEITTAIANGVKLWWNDPDPIEGNDYTVSLIEPYEGGTCLIQYNEGGSEAEVYDHELQRKLTYLD